MLSKFDVTLGPKVVVQAPEGVLSKAQFDPIKKYVEKHTSISKNKTFLFHSYGAATLRQKTDCRNTLKHAFRGCSGFNSTSFRFFSPLQQLPITSFYLFIFRTGHFLQPRRYLIPKPELCNRLVTVNTPEHHILGHPVDIEANHYPRNHLIFNVALVFDTNAEASMFEPLLRKYATHIIKSYTRRHPLSNPFAHLLLRAIVYPHSLFFEAPLVFLLDFLLPLCSCSSSISSLFEQNKNP